MLSVFNEGALPPVPASFNMAAYVLAAGARTPGKTALEVLGEADTEQWTYERLISAVRGTGTGLLRLGLVPGDRVLLRLGNTVDFPVACLGALAAGLVPVPTSAALTEPEVAHCIAVTTPRAILCAPGVACPPVTERTGLATLRSFRDLPPVAWHMGDPHRPGYIVFTSGTSGMPRAVVHAHRAILGRRMMFDGWYGLTLQDRMLHAGAFNWTYTLGTGLMDPWTLGATALIAASGTTARALPGLIARHKASLFAAAPGVFRQMLQDGPTIAAPSLRHGLSAGEKLPARTARAWKEATGTPLLEAYGMSECSTFISAAPARHAHAGALGYPQPGRRIAVLGPEGPVPRGTEGTIAVHRSDPGLMLGYYGAPEATAARMQGEWFMTGDQGLMQHDGQIFYLGRNDDMMNAGGYRVSPVEVEDVLSGCPGVRSVAVTDVEIKDDTRVIAAFYTADAPLDEKGLEAYVSDRLARYKQPRLYIHLPELPLGANGKILRRALRDRMKAPK
ncbi:class I adenylate-forming enzyme family protein [Roseobacter sp.]|uniref:class I adenylate-forming enzyme family protein n=1 Tax=Roseobacter sp. TaxID=1907202 RepID=UPI0025E48955|nr:class I adenylate-forming enzyme family protein [Roseobacter sp.]